VAELCRELLKLDALDAAEEPADDSDERAEEAELAAEDPPVAAGAT